LESLVSQLEVSCFARRRANVHQGESDKVLDAIERWVQSAQQPGRSDAEELGRMVEDMLQHESSYAEKNAKRYRQVNEAFQKPNFQVIVNCVDFLMLPIDTGVNRLLKRTSILKQIRFHDCGQDPQNIAALAELKFNSAEMFLEWACGDFGRRIIQEFSEEMQSGHLARICQGCTDISLLQTCFELVVFAMSDTWMRFCLMGRTFPNRMFELAKCDKLAFAQKWAEFRSVLHNCHECIDAGFSSPLLRSVDMTALSESEAEAFIVEFPGFSLAFKKIQTICLTVELSPVCLTKSGNNLTCKTAWLLS
jgi:hypothetical protein